MKTRVSLKYFLNDCGLLIKGISKTIKNEAKEQKEDFLEYYQLGTLGNLLTGKRTIRAGEGTVRAGQDF